MVSCARERHAAARRLYWPAAVTVVLLAITTYIYTDIRTKIGIDPGIMPIASLAVLLSTIYFINRRQMGWAFAFTGLHIVLTQIAFFTLMFPRLMISSTNPAWSLTIDNASSSQYTLGVMSIVALIFVPIVLAYQGWTYYVFRKQITVKKASLVYSVTARGPHGIILRHLHAAAVARRCGDGVLMHRRLFGLTSTARLPMIIAITGGLLAGMCSIAQARLLSGVVDAAFLQRLSLDSVWPGMRFLLAVIGARGLLTEIQELAAGEGAIRIKQVLRDRLFAHIVQLGPSFTRGEKTGELSAVAVDGIEALDAYYSQYLPQLAIGVLVPVFILAIVFPLDPLSGAILLVTAPLIPFFMYMIGRTAEQATARQFAALGRLSSHLLDSIQGLVTLKLFGQSKAQVENIRRVAEQFRKSTLRVLQVSFLSAFALELLATVSTAIIAVEVGLRLLYGQLAFREALFLLIVAPEFYMPLRMLGARFHAGKTGTAAARRIFEVLDAPATARARHDQSEDSRQPIAALSQPDAGIVFRDVSYTYPGGDRPALEHISLAIQPRAHVALVGASGAGKSTLAALILGFARPTTGELRLGDDPRIGGSSWRVGWVPQAPHLFSESIAANVRLGAPNASDEEVREAVRLSHLDDFVESLPEGLDTTIGEGGARLSSGEAQRLALARAFLLNAPILVLDEPTSSLDSENEAALVESLSKLGVNRTVVVIAHRLNTVEKADEIIVLDAGRIVERGTHSQLLAAKGAYKRLLDAGTEARTESSSPIESPLPTAAASVAGASNARWYCKAAPVANITNLAVLRQLASFLHGSWRHIGFAVVLSALTIGSSVALMGTSAWLISAAALQPSIASLQVAIVAVRLFGLARAAFRYFERLVSHNVTFSVLRNIRVWFYAHLEPLAPARLMDYHAGDLVNRALADVGDLENLYVRVIGPALTALAVGAVISACFYLQAGAGLGLVLAAGFLSTGLLVPMLSLSLAAGPGTRMLMSRSELRAHLVDGIQGLPDLAAFGQIQNHIGGLIRTSAAYRRAQSAMVRVSGFQAGLSAILIHFSIWCSLVLLIPRAVADQNAGLLLAPLALAALASFEAVAGLPQAGQLLPTTLAAARRLLEIVSAPPAVARVATEPPKSPSASGDCDIEFRNVSFTYPGRARPALNNLGVAVREGELVAVVGPSGAGKSTLAQLLLRHWECDAGSILLRGQPVRSMTPEAARSHIGYSSQHPYVFDTSIFENLRLARRGLRREDLEEAADRSGLQDFVQSLPHGMDTLVGEHGARLSAGERQRLGLARIILKDAPMLMLDEPTANLDMLMEVRILDLIFELAAHKTCVLITHRLRRMERFDRILVLESGTVREQGSHSSLVAAGGLYSRLWTLRNGAPAMP